MWRPSTISSRSKAGWTRVIEAVDDRFLRLEDRFDQLDARFEASEDEILGEMRRELTSLTWKLFAIYGASIGALVAVTKL